MNYNRLSPRARDVIRASGRTIASYVRAGGYFDGEWHGDYCGCRDNRCIGYHHDGGDYCHCLDAWLEDLDKLKEAHDLWHAYRAAVEANDGAGDPVAYDAAWARAERWVRRYRPYALTFSLDAIVAVRECRPRYDESGTYAGYDRVIVPTGGISITLENSQDLTNVVAEGDHFRQLVWYSTVDELGLVKQLAAA